MSITKNSGKHALLAMITVVMMVISVITIKPSVVNANSVEPEGYDWTIKIGTAESSGKPCIKYLSGAPSLGSYEINLYKYKDGNWDTFVEKLNKSYLNPNDMLKFNNIEYDVYYRVTIKDSVSCYVYFEAPTDEEESGGGSGENGSGGSDNGGSSNEDKQATCPHNKGWTSADTDGSLKCLLCGFVCDHSKNTNDKKEHEDYKSDEAQGHHLEYTVKCSVCQHKDIEKKSPIEAHTFSSVSYQSDGKHYKSCPKCDYGTLEKCDYEVKKAEYCTDSSFPDAASKGHNATYVCKICGHEERETQEKHKLVNGKCTVCGWKKVTPGKLTGVKVKVKSKKTVKKTFRSRGYFDYLGRWVSGKTTHSTFKICKVNISFKKAKNAYQYKIQKTPGSGTTYPDSWITKKTSNKYEMWFKSGTGKVTLKITPYSKEGVKGKTVKKTFRV